MVTINGEKLALEGVNLLDWLTSRNYDPMRVAVERNEEIVPQARYGETVLAEGDVIEIVNFVGGG